MDLTNINNNVTIGSFCKKVLEEMRNYSGNTHMCETNVILFQSSMFRMFNLTTTR